MLLSYWKGDFQPSSGSQESQEQKTFRTGQSHSKAMGSRVSTACWARLSCWAVTWSVHWKWEGFEVSHFRLLSYINRKDDWSVLCNCWWIAGNLGDRSIGWLEKTHQSLKMKPRFLERLPAEVLTKDEEMASMILGPLSTHLCVGSPLNKWINKLMNKWGSW